MNTMMQRGECKTPGGKLVAVNVEMDERGHILSCHIDGDFFMDGGDDATMCDTLHAIERALVTGRSARSALARRPAPVSDSSRTRAAGSARLIGVGAEAIDIAWSRAVRKDRSAQDRRVAAALPGVRGETDRRLCDMARRRWRQLRPRVIHDRPRLPADQMRIDEQRARRLAAGTCAASLRIWEWAAPAVVIGRFQSLPDEVDLAEARREGITVVRRCTGGGAMFVEPGNTITYSLYAPLDFVRDVSIAQSYRLCDQWLIDALAPLGLHVGFSGLNDIASPVGKIGGAAQRRFPAVGAGPGAVLHHVTLAYDIDAAKMSRILRVSQEKISDKAVVSAVKRVDPLRSQTGMSRETLIGRLIAAAAAEGYNSFESKQIHDMEVVRRGQAQ